MGQRRFEELDVAELIAEPLLTALKAVSVVGFGCRVRRLNHDSLLDFSRRPSFEIRVRPDDAAEKIQICARDEMASNAIQDVIESALRPAGLNKDGKQSGNRPLVT